MSELIVVRRSRAQNFTVLDNSVLRDRHISWKAKGLYSFLSSCSSSYRLTIKRLVEHSGDGRESTMSAVRELQRCGYLQIKRVRGAGGRFVSTTWIVIDPADRSSEDALSSTAPPRGGNKFLHGVSGRAICSRSRVCERDNDHDRDSRIVDGDHERENRVPVTPSSTTEETVQSKSTTTTTASGSTAEPDLYFQDGLHQAERAEMLKVVRKYPLELAQQLLDEVADHADTEIRSSRVGYLAWLAGKAERGEFRFARGAAVAKKREARHAHAAKQAVAAQERQEQKARAAQPPSAAVLAHIERVRELIGGRA
jgi:hypothetical protein